MGRSAAVRLMVDACVITRVTGETTDPDTGVVTAASDTVYEGPCKVSGDRPYETDMFGGGRVEPQQRLILHLPVSVGPVQAGDAVMVTASVYQPHLAGREYRVAGPDERSWQTAQRVFIDT